MSATVYLEAAQQSSDRIAVVEASSGRQWTRRELWSTGRRLSRALRDAGVQEGDTIAIVAPNCGEYLVAYIAALFGGMYLVPINWHLTPVEMSYVMENSGAQALIVHERLAAAVMRAIGHLTRPAARTLIAIGTARGYESLHAFIANHTEEALGGAVWGRVQCYSSATTGLPKAIRQPLGATQIAVQRQIELQIAQGIALDAHVHLCCTMLYHQHGMQNATTALLMGHTIIVMDGWAPENMLRLIDEHAVTTTAMVPTMFVRLLRLEETVRIGCDVSSLRQVIHGGAPCPVEIKRAMLAWWGKVFWEFYGGTEGQGTIADSDQWLCHPGTVGRAFPGGEIRILDDQGRDLPSGQAGDVYLKQAPGWAFEYLGAEAKTALSRRGEYFTLGDVGYLNSQGYLFLCDRKIDMINSGGVKIYSAEIEQVLLSHPQVVDCAVVAFPDQLFGEVPLVVVQPVPETSGDALLTARLLQFLGNKLSAKKFPRRIAYTSQLPREPNGKIRKRLLREQYCSSLELSNPIERGNLHESKRAQ